MDKEQVKAIELQGIARNQTKIGVQDGQCEDIINLRFKDGSWRAAGKGKLVHTNGTSYEQMYIHTNVYHHLLGVSNGTLYWFANIDTDCVTFKPLATPVAITNVTGTVTIVQTGHLLTIIDEADNFEYFVFKTNTNSYRKVTTQQNDNSNNREIFPFGSVNFNLSRNDEGSILEYDVRTISQNSSWFDDVFDPKEDNSFMVSSYGLDYFRNKGKNIYGKQTGRNYFTRPFLAVAAIKLYDGSYLYASQIVYLYPNEMPNKGDTLYGKKALSGEVDGVDYGNYGYVIGATQPTYGTEIKKLTTPDINSYACVPVTFVDSGKRTTRSIFVGGENTDVSNYDKIKENYNIAICETYETDTPPTFSAGIHAKDGILTAYYATKVLAFDLAVSIRNTSFLSDNEDVFKSLCIFVTPEVDDFLFENGDSIEWKWINSFDVYRIYTPKRKTADQISNELMHQPFYLLKEYDKNTINELLENPIVDLSKTEDEGLLKNLTEQDTLTSEAFKTGDSYIPKATYLYNGRLHIANYTKHVFSGYLIDTMQLNNHILQYEKGNYYKHTLKDLKRDSLDVYMQHPKVEYPFYDVDYDFITYDTSLIPYFIERNAYFVLVKVYLADNEEVIRVIKPYDCLEQKDGEYPNFIEDLSPLLMYPDSRANKMDIYFINPIDRQDNSYINVSSASFQLKAHTYLDLAYYINEDLLPIAIGRFNGVSIPKSDFVDADLGTNYTYFLEAIKKATSPNTTEYYPNGLKVSKTNNPLYFPSENTYLVGSAEIIALMSNAVAIGTGQTGAAPLYVFCKDGVYTLLVDEKGEMAYTNSRIIARDVCNNAKSVTPIDTGVVFTTDRGLMEIAGSEVQEIGQKAEGDVFDYNTDSTTDKAKKIMYNAFTMRKLADLPEALLDNVDFLTFLKGSIVNYNHNERELMVSNPDYDYSYIMDRNGDWSRRDIAADEYVNNYPTSYRVQSNKFYKVDEEETGRDTADNSIYAMSQVVKLDSIGFKELHRVIARGYFETLEQSTRVITSGDFFGTDTGNAFITVNRLYSKKDNINLFGRDIKELIGRKFEMYVKNTYGSTSAIRFGMAIKTGDDETVYGTDVLTEACLYGEEKTIQFDFGVKGVISPYYNATSIYLYAYSGDSSTPINTTAFKYSFSEIIEPPYLGLYLFGSYDGRKWALLGHREKQGKFTDIGTLVERTDCKFFRFVLAGQITKDSRLDYFEVSSNPSKLNTKIR